MRKLLSFIFMFVTAMVIAQIDSDHLMVGETAPVIIGKDQNGKTINSEKILKTQDILLIFYRGNWCPHCKKHLSSLQGHLKEFEEKGVFVMVVSPEKLEKTKETGDQYNNDFSVVHDSNNKIMRDFKVAFEVNESTVPMYYEKLNTMLSDYNDNNGNVLPVPATYLIDKSGKITYVQYDPDYKKRSDLTEILALLD